MAQDFSLSLQTVRRKDFIRDKIYTLAYFANQADFINLLNLSNQRETNSEEIYFS